MRKSIFFVLMSIICIFCINVGVFAADIFDIEIINIEYPFVGDAKDMTIGVNGNKCSVKEVIWYKDGARFEENEFYEEGKYVCRIYLNENPGYKILPTTAVYSNADKSTLGLQDNLYFVELEYKVKNFSTKYPKIISFSNMSYPQVGKDLDTKITSNNPEFYDYVKIEWYKDGKLCKYPQCSEIGEYVCRVYIELYNGFEITSNVIARLSGNEAEKITKDVYGTFFEILYIVNEKEDPREVTQLRIEIKEKPSYGQSLEKVSVKKSAKSNYYEIADVEWYHNDFRMLDEYFYEGEYKCRIYINFINGGYPLTGIKAYINNSSSGKKCYIMGNRYFVDVIYKIDKYTVSTLKFDELNIPEYGAVQDTRIESLEPGIYTPSMVYWYNEKGKYMSNMETFGEGKYTCKFTLTLNVDCDVKEKLKAIINNDTASAYIENNKITIEKIYEIKKPEKKWSKASSWAVPELEDAINYALIPTSIDSQDFTQSITRAEFAAVAVRLYEALTLKSARPVESNPFTDTSDSEVLKAYNLGITNGTSETTFEPKNLITRQEMATMMVRTLEKAGIATGINLNKVKKFEDHSKIESWALNGVYFMSDIGIIKGKGNNVFDVLGSATREEALAISIRSVNYYK